MGWRGKADSTVRHRFIIQGNEFPIPQGRCSGIIPQRADVRKPDIDLRPCRRAGFPPSDLGLVIRKQI